MAYSEAQKRASAKYNAKAYDRIEIKVPKGEKDKIKAHANQHDGGSLNGFVNRAIMETMSNDSD